MLFGRERHRWFIIRAGQPENNMGDVVLRFRRKAAHGGERLIEKFCHWWLGLKFTVDNLYIITRVAARKANAFIGRCKDRGSDSPQMGGSATLIVSGERRRGAFTY